MLDWQAQTSRPIAWPSHNLQAIAEDRQFREVSIQRELRWDRARYLNWRVRRRFLAGLPLVRLDPGDPAHLHCRLDPSAFEHNDGSRIRVETTPNADDDDPVRQELADRREQAALELKVFAEFRERSGLHIVPASVEKRDPPEPDIFCEIEGRGGVAFELAALRDRKSAKIMSDLAKEDIPDESPYWRLDSREAIRHVCRKKRNATYSTKHPIDLVLYAEGPLAPEDVVIPYIQSAFQYGSCLGPFQSVWFMGRPNENCCCLLWVPAESDTEMNDVARVKDIPLFDREGS